MSRRLARIAILGATAVVLGLIAAPGASAQEAASCLDLAIFTEEPATIVSTNGNGWLVDEEELDTDPMAKMKPPIVPAKQVPVVPADTTRAHLSV